MTDRYLTMLYYGQLILFQNEIGPQTPTQMAFVVFSLVISLFFQIKVFGDIATIWDSWTHKSQQLYRSLDAANETMRLMNLDDEL